MKIEHFVPNDDVLERFAEEAGVSVSAIVRYYRFEISGGPIADVGRFFPARKETTHQPYFEYLDGGRPFLRLGETEVPKPRSRPLERRSRVSRLLEAEPPKVPKQRSAPRRKKRPRLLDEREPSLYPR